MKTAFLQQFSGYDYHVVTRQRRADDGMRTRDVISETISGHQVKVAAILFEMGNTVGLEQDLYEGVLACPCARNRMGDPVLANLDLAELQPRDSRVINPSFQRRAVKWIDVELAAKLSQCISPALDLPLGRQSGGTEGMH